jgi:hypothetical protein
MFNWRLFSSVASALCLALIVASTASAAGASVRKVQILDVCDAASFNAVLGPGSCVKEGDTTFDELVDQLLTQGTAPAWRNSPTKIKLAAGGRIESRNIGGEAHTLTPVAEFGGGCVQELNDLLGGLTPVPECSDGPLFGATLVFAGETLDLGPFAAGETKLMCLIHPWMIATVEAR